VPKVAAQQRPRHRFLRTNSQPRQTVLHAGQAAGAAGEGDKSLNETMLAMRCGLDILRAMTREAAAEIFERIALLMELKGEAPFKTRAYI
jgi:hypothetical protein